MTAIRLLIVEDEFLIRMTLAEMLVDDGYVVVEAGDADEALAALEADRFDVLLTDIQLPGTLDGRALAARARTRRPDLPVIFMSGRPEPDVGRNPLDVHINKPYLPSTVSAAVRRLTQGLNRESDAA